jgi:hypothetical protein
MFAGQFRQAFDEGRRRTLGLHKFARATQSRRLLLAATYTTSDVNGFKKRSSTLATRYQ